MDELVFYVTAGDPNDKHAQESLGAAASIHKAQHFATFRNAESPQNGAALSGFGKGERLFVIGNNKALITSYAWGKEGADQRFPVPEQLACLALAQSAPTNDREQKTTYRTPWLLAAGSKTGKLYIWELASGDLVCVKDAHYQEISTLQFSPCGTFLATGGLDARVNIWKTQELITPDLASASRPHATFSDHALAITQVQFPAAALASDYRLLTSSKDGTLRIYDVLTKSLLTTFVFSTPVECFARDPAGRALYAGLGDGSIRQVNLYVVNPFSHVLESVGGSSKIVTVETDPNLTQTFVHHQTTPGCRPTCVAVSMDGMSLVSGDSAGSVFVSDVVTKQVVKAFTPCKSAIAHLQLGVVSKQTLNSETSFDKKHRLLPQLKRVLVSTDTTDRKLTMQIAPERQPKRDFDAWLQAKAQEELQFRSRGEVAGKSASEKQLQEKFDKVSDAYNSLKVMYEELVEENESR